MIYTTTINGLNIEAEFHDYDVEHVFMPLLEDLATYQKAKGERVVVFVAAPPASGKSIFCALLQELSNRIQDTTFISLGMDGFHFNNEYLNENYTDRNGQTICLAEIKGAPETFDVTKLENYIKRVSAGDQIMWPSYNRITHSVIENDICVKGDVVFIEGNYLLLESGQWDSLADYADCTISLEVDEKILRQRLIRRKMMGGLDCRQAEAFVDASDMYNVKLCQNYSKKSSIAFLYKQDGSYMILI